MEKKERTRIKISGQQFWAFLLVAWLLFIFGHSMVPAQISSEESGTLLVLLLDLADGLGIDAGWLTEHILRKMAHFTEYGVYGVLLWINSKNGRRERRYSRAGWQEKVFPLALAVIGAPFLDETIQLFTPGRSGRVEDVWLDMAGCLTGLLLTKLFMELLGKLLCRKNGRQRRGMHGRRIR